MFVRVLLLCVLLVAGCGAAEDGEVRGTVTSADGTPLAECAVAPVDGRGVPETAAVTDSDGTYRWRLPAGDYEMGVTCDAGEVVEPVTVEGGETVLLDVRLPG